MISASDRRQAVELIEEAVAAGARRQRACQELNLSLRTYQRWTQEGELKIDQRALVKRPAPANKLTEQERERILEICNRPEYSHLPPTQIIPALADKGIYVASEASFYRVLRQAGQLQHRGQAQAPKKLSKPQSYKANRPNELWSWDSVP